MEKWDERRREEYSLPNLSSLSFESFMSEEGQWEHIKIFDLPFVLDGENWPWNHMGTLHNSECRVGRLGWENNKLVSLSFPYSHVVWLFISEATNLPQPPEVNLRWICSLSSRVNSWGQKLKIWQRLKGVLIIKCQIGSKVSLQEGAPGLWASHAEIYTSTSVTDVSCRCQLWLPAIRWCQAFFNRHRAPHTEVRVQIQGFPSPNRWAMGPEERSKKGRRELWRTKQQN